MILVTGGTGGIGSELLRLLSHAGGPPRALTRNLQKAQTLPGITWVVGDLARPETLTTAFEGATTVFLLVWEEPGRHSRRRPRTATCSAFDSSSEANQEGGRGGGPLCHFLRPPSNERTVLVGSSSRARATQPLAV